MERKKSDNSASLGRLPANAPLANPYVPFQESNPPQYEAKMGLVRGTLFPGLDLPFMGMVNREELPATAVAQLQSLSFAIQELALYLDTHPEDKEALEMYRQYQQVYHNCMMEYGKENGPMSHAMPGKGDGYQWIHDPWPWDAGIK